MKIDHQALSRTNVQGGLGVYEELVEMQAVQETECAALGLYTSHKFNREK
jgi:hypothetical protein